MNDNQIIKTYWEGSISNLETLSIKSFIANGHTIIIYTYDNRLKSFDKNMLVLDAAEIVPKSKRLEVKGVSTIFSDLFRYYLLDKIGGWWMDLDIVLLKPITTEKPIVASLQFFKQTQDGYMDHQLNAAPLKISQGHALAKSCIRSCESYDLGKLCHAQLSGCLLEKEIAKLNLSNFIVPAEIYSPIGWGEAHRVVEPKFGFDRITPNTVAVHLFNYMWTHKEHIDKNGKYHPDSLYEYLKRRYL